MAKKPRWPLKKVGSAADETRGLIADVRKHGMDAIRSHTLVRDLSDVMQLAWPTPNGLRGVLNWFFPQEEPARQVAAALFRVHPDDLAT